jgi:hypothetical protein
MADMGTHAKDLRVWRNFIANPGFYAPRKHLIGPDTKVFTMGSCFALEVRRALQRRGIAVHPDYLSVKYKLGESQFSSFTETCEFQPHYDTFVIRQEFETALELWKDRRDCFIKYSGTPTNKQVGWDTVYQDPHRKITWARSPELLNGLVDQIDRVVIDGVRDADVIVLTLGLTEVWRGNASGKYFCQFPRDPSSATFQASTFQQNYDNMRATLDMLFSKYPNKQVILSVSPVPLDSTFRENMDVATANMESKSTLRTVAAQICREYTSNVTYFPSYEMANCMPIPVFQEDRRHVLPEFADRVVAGFLSCFSKE